MGINGYMVCLELFHTLIILRMQKMRLSESKRERTHILPSASIFANLLAKVRKISRTTQIREIVLQIISDSVEAEDYSRARRNAAILLEAGLTANSRS